MTNNSPSKLYPQKIDLTNCDKEPVHLLGKIQNHGILIACDIEHKKITYCSDNLTLLFNKTAEAILGSTIYDLLENIVVEDLFLQLENKNTAYKEVFINGDRLTIIAHASQEQVIIEFEYNKIMLDAFEYQIKLTEIVSKINSAKEIKERCDQVATLVKDYLKYDRVMIYQFDEEWNGSVISEKKEPHLESWLGLHYPASDIPQQARKLFLKQGVRIIADVNSKAVNVLANKAHLQNIDLSRSELRSVSPIHIEYLKNMQVGATLTAAIVYDDTLWGLIACHHYSPKYINYFQRLSCKFITQVFATKVQLNNTDTILEKIKSSTLVRSQLIDQIYSKEGIVKGLSQFPLTINNLTESTGAAIFMDGRITTVGDCPSDDAIIDLINFFKNGEDKEVYQTNHLSSIFDKAKSYKQSASGVLCLFLAKKKSDALLWFKPEVVETVNWAGNPEKMALIDEENKLTPRKSFAKWSVEQEGKSKPWADYEISECISLQKSIIDLILEKYEEVKQLNLKLKMAYDELESFSYSVSHDLRAPLRGIDGFAHIIKEEYYDSLDSFGKSSIETIISSVDKMNMLIDDILQYSGLGQKPVDYRAFSVKKEIDTLLLDLNLIYKNVEVNIEDHLPDLFGDRKIVVLLLKNLLENAMKYSSKVENPTVTIGSLDKHTFYVKDNGVGFDMKFKDQIFGVFNRLVNEEYSGSGIGLAIAKRVVDKHNGKIWVESEINKGSTFYFCLV